MRSSYYKLEMVAQIFHLKVNQIVMASQITAAIVRANYNTQTKHQA